MNKVNTPPKTVADMPASETAVQKPAAVVEEKIVNGQTKPVAATHNTAAKKPAAAKPTAAVTAPAKASTAAPAAKKAANPPKPKPPAAAKPAAVLKDKVKKPKLIRDSFTMPELEYEAIGQVKKACLKAGFEIKKSELLRIGVAVVRQMEIANLKDVLNTLPKLKTGRPKKV